MEISQEVFEKILGMQAVEKKFINEKQLRQCLNIMELFERDKTLVQLLLEKGFMTQNQIKRLTDAILKDLGGTIEKPQEKKDTSSLFGMIAIGKTLINQHQLDQALNEQKSYYERGIKVQIGQILQKKGLVTLTQISNILEEQKNKTFYCKKCKISVTVHHVKNEIQQCQHCGLDLEEMQVKKKPKKEKAPELEEMTLDVLEI